MEPSREFVDSWNGPEFVGMRVRAFTGTFLIQGPGIGGVQGPYQQVGFRQN